WEARCTTANRRARSTAICGSSTWATTGAAPGSRSGRSGPSTHTPLATITLERTDGPRDRAIARLPGRAAQPCAGHPGGPGRRAVATAGAAVRLALPGHGQAPGPGGRALLVPQRRGRRVVRLLPGGAQGRVAARAR